MVGKLFGIPRRWLTRIGSFCASLTVGHPILTIRKPDFPDPVKDPVEIGINEDALKDFVKNQAIPDNLVTTDTQQTISGTKTFTSNTSFATSTGKTTVYGGLIHLSRTDGSPFIRFFSLPTDSVSAAYIYLTAEGILSIVSQSGKNGVMISADANLARLYNAPTIGQSDKTSKAIATCGWCNTQLAQIDHTHDDAYAAKTHSHGNITSSGTIVNANNKFVITDKDGNILGSTGYLLPSEISALQACGVFVTDANAPSGRVVKNLYLTEDYGNRSENGILLRGGNAASIEFFPTGATNGGYIDFHLGGDASNYTSRIIETTLYGSGAGLHIIGNVAVWLKAPANEAKLANAPTTTPANASSSKAIATLGWVASNFVKASGYDANKWVKTDAEGKIVTTTDKVISVAETDTPFSGTKTVVTGVTWNGTKIVINSETWTYKNGALISTVANTASTINTVTYNP